ncbi:hypothetical protein [uncultured Luteimonas sp.]|uniref:hypothetical protein n=1 Tax=uncultured Luteimonas sp. TaxID=453144 RepID=UPI00262F9AE8|nr:hypothetical protein [uncultured Luteimonas sp.]
MQTPLTIPSLLPPRFVLQLPPALVERLHHLCRFDTPAQTHSAVFDACNIIESQVKPEHFGQPFVHAAAYLLVLEFAYYRRAQTRKKPKCMPQVLNLIDPFRKGFVPYD